MKGIWDRPFYSSVELPNEIRESTIIYWPTFPVNYRTLEDPKSFERYKRWLVENLRTISTLFEWSWFWLFALESYKEVKGAPSIYSEIKIEEIISKENDDKCLWIKWPGDYYPHYLRGRECLRVLDILMNAYMDRSLHLLLNLQNYAEKVKKHARFGKLPWEEYDHLVIHAPPRKLPRTVKELINGLEICFNEREKIRAFLKIINSLKDLVDVYQGQIRGTSSSGELCFYLNYDTFEFEWPASAVRENLRDSYVYDKAALEKAEEAAKTLLGEWEKYAYALCDRLDNFGRRSKRKRRTSRP